jgi:methyl-accepting chemotaxis protein
LKLKYKLPLAFATVLVIMMAAAVGGLLAERAALETFNTGKVHHYTDLVKKTQRIEIDFQTQIQEWNNVLLRGEDIELLNKHWESFEKIEKQVQASAKQVMQQLQQLQAPAPVIQKVQTFMQEHQIMSDGYRDGLDQLQAANMDHKKGDAVVRGKDRKPSQDLRDLSGDILKLSLAAQTQAKNQAQRAFISSLVAMLVCLGAGVGIALWISRQTVRPLTAAVAFARRVAQGDLTGRAVVQGNDELADMNHALNEMQDALNQLVQKMRTNALHLAQASQEISQGNLDLGQRTEQQANALQQQAASMDELEATVRHNAQSANEANRLAQHAQSVATHGGEAMNQVVSTIRDINTSSRKIGDIISVMDGIAFQTNILALNAAVEAARAGEAGRGFAVVATEVRNLAGRASLASREIRSLITSSLEQVEQGTQQVDAAGQTMQDAIVSIQKVTALITNIDKASSQQSTGVGQVSQAISQLDQTTQQNAALVEQMSASGEKLHHQAQALVHAVSVFKTKEQLAIEDER